MNPALTRVLAIDDSPDVLALLAVRLKPEGLHLVTAASYDEGMAAALAVRPDLILLDVDLAGDNGLDLCRRLKANPLTCAIPIIFLTASSDVDTKVHGFDLGAVDYVTKPFHPAELRARVRAALRMKRAQDLLTVRAQVDALTGLHNRAYFDERLVKELAESARSGAPCSLVLLDLDHFKRLNDSFGHPFGDLVLQRVGEMLAQSLRPCDAACRYGGEEMALILVDTPLAAAEGVADRVRQHVSRIELAPRGQPVAVTASFGVAEALEVAARVGDVAPARLIEEADAALYAAKDAGRDCVRAVRAAPAERPLRRAS